MEHDLIKQLFEQFEAACYNIENVECWSAREMQTLLGYNKWENFEKVLAKAKGACANAGERIEDHFPEVTKMVQTDAGTARKKRDIALTRFACYLIAQIGDSRKQETVFAQTYFAVKNRRAELVEQRLLEFERIKTWEKLGQPKKQPSRILFERGIDEKGFARIHSKGDPSLFKLKAKMDVPDDRPVASF